MTIGMIAASCDPSIPTGWLVCDGSSYPNSDYPALAALLGQTFGPGDGGPSFQLPNLQNMFIRGLDVASGSRPATGRDPDVATRSAMVPNYTPTGAVVGSLQGSQVGSHSHNVSGNCCADIGCCVSAYLPDNTQDPWGSTDPWAGPPEVTPKYTQVLFLIKAA